MKNFPIKVDDKEYWVSRSCAVVGIIYKTFDVDGKLYILANKRGKGCPDYVGKWNVTCGYLDYNESLLQAVSREIYEEVGLTVPILDWKLWVINSIPSDNKQAVSFRFYAEYKEEYGYSNKDHCEKDEVDEIRWIPFDEIDKYDWAFNQREVLTDFIALMLSGKIKSNNDIIIY